MITIRPAGKGRFDQSIDSTHATVGCRLGPILQLVMVTLPSYNPLIYDTHPTVPSPPKIGQG